MNRDSEEKTLHKWLASQSKSPERVSEMVDETLLSIARQFDLYVDFTGKQYDGDKDMPMDRIGLLEHLRHLVSQRISGEHSIHSMVQPNP